MTPDSTGKNKSMAILGRLQTVVALRGFLQGRIHPEDIGPAIRFFRRFQHSAYMSKAIGHWTTGAPRESARHG